jgi:hypothetical protein
VLLCFFIFPIHNPFVHFSSNPELNQETQTSRKREYIILKDKRLTVCVTRAGAGGGTPSDWENAEA